MKRTLDLNSASESFVDPPSTDANLGAYETHEITVTDH